MSVPCNRWDAVIIEGNTKPMITISPNDQLKNKKDGDILDIEILNTGSVYDNKKMTGILAKNCNTPSYRPNYSEQTGYYTIVLNAPWFAYPEHNGEVKFDQQDIITEPKTEDTPIISTKENYNDKKEPVNKKKNCTRCALSGLGVLQIILISTVIITLILLVIFSPKK